MVVTIHIPTFHIATVKPSDVPEVVQSIASGLCSPLTTDFPLRESSDPASLTSQQTNKEDKGPQLTWPPPSDAIEDDRPRSGDESTSYTTDPHSSVSPEINILPQYVTNLNGENFEVPDKSRNSETRGESGGGHQRRTLYHIVISNEFGFERTIYRRWSHVQLFDQQWSTLYPDLHKQFQLVAPKLSIFQSKLKRQTARLHALQSYFNGILPIACLRSFLAHFLEVPVTVFSSHPPGALNPSPSPKCAGPTPEEIALMAMGLKSPIRSETDEETTGTELQFASNPHGNTLVAHERAKKQLAKFHKQNRRVFEKMMPTILQVAANQKANEINKQSPSPQPVNINDSGQTTNRRSDPNLLTEFQRAPPALPPKQAATAPSTRRGSRRNSLIKQKLNGPGSKTINLPITSRSSTLQAVPMTQSNHDQVFTNDVDMMSTMDYSKLQHSSGRGSGSEKTSRAISPTAEHNLEQAATTKPMNQGLPSRSSIRRVEPLALHFRTGSGPAAQMNELRDWHLVSGGSWWYTRDKNGNECYFRSAEQGGRAAMIRARNLNEDQLANSTHIEALLPTSGPPLPRRGTIYKRVLAAQSKSASMPGSVMPSRRTSPTRQNSTHRLSGDGVRGSLKESSASLPLTPNDSFSMSSSNHSKLVLSSKRQSQPRAALLYHSKLKSFLESQQEHPKQFPQHVSSPSSTRTSPKKSWSRRSSRQSSAELGQGELNPPAVHASSSRPSSRRNSLAHSGEAAERAPSPSPKKPSGHRSRQNSLLMTPSKPPAKPQVMTHQSDTPLRLQQPIADDPAKKISSQVEPHGKGRVQNSLGSTLARRSSLPILSKKPSSASTSSTSSSKASASVPTSPLTQSHHLRMHSLTFADVVRKQMGLEVSHENPNSEQDSQKDQSTPIMNASPIASQPQSQSFHRKSTSRQRVSTLSPILINDAADNESAAESEESSVTPPTFHPSPTMSEMNMNDQLPHTPLPLVNADEMIKS